MVKKDTLGGCRHKGEKGKKRMGGGGDDVI